MCVISDFNRILMIFIALLVLGIPGHGIARVHSPSDTEMPTHLGANLPGISDYSLTPVYVDLMNQARRFGTAAKPWDETAILGNDGWPVGDFGVVLLIGATRYAGNDGAYQLSFSGRAEVAAVASSAKVLRVAYDAAQNRTKADVVMPATEDQLMLAFTNTGPGIKNVKIVRPGYDAVDPPLFTKSFLGHIARFKTLRFMDWLRTNNNPVTSWKTRATPLDTHYASKAGVPWEHIISLANQAHKDIWINIPIGADDDYVAHLARLLKSSLNGSTKIYLEYSNEVWNGGFGQYAVNREAAIQDAQTNPASKLVYDGNAKPQIIAFRRVAMRLKEISDIFRDVYGDASMMSVVRPVFSSQVVQPLTAKVGLDFIAAVYGPPNKYFYALAGAPYFNLGRDQTTEGLSRGQILDAMRNSVSQLPVVNAMEGNMALATWYSLKFFAYEAGADTFGPGSLSAKKSASLDPEMFNVCVTYLTTWYRQGGGLLMWFMAGAGNWDTRYGTWELTTDLALPDTPKIKCIDKVLGWTPEPKGRNQIPGTIDAAAYVGNMPPYSASSISRLRYLHPGSSVDYLVMAPSTGSYSLVIRAAADRPGNKINVAVNSKLVKSGLEFAATGWGKPTDNSPVKLDLAKGFNTLRLTTTAANLGFSISNLTIQ